MRSLSLARNLFILLLLLSPFASASQFDDPYQGNIAVVDQSEDELKVLALKQVLVKVSGNAEIAQFNDSKLLLQKTESLLSQYGYQTLLNARYFVAVFDKRKVNQALKEMQQPVWGETRPITQVWLIDDSNNERHILSDNMISLATAPEISSAFLNQQLHRGIRLQFPLMDLEDSLALSTSDILGRFYDPIAKASKRYGVEHFVVASMKQISAENWSLSWELVKSDPVTHRNKVLASDKASGQKSSLVSNMVSAIADYYASQYAILENQGEKFSQTIYVRGINSLAELAQLNNTLSSMLAIASYAVTSVDGSQVTVNIKINGGLSSFKNGLFAQPHLQPDLSQDEAFHFYWR